MKNILTIIRSVADSPAKVRPCDAWRLYDAAQTAGCLFLVKKLIKKENPAVFAEMLNYESEEIESALSTD